MGARGEGNSWRYVGEAVGQEACFQFWASLFVPFIVIHTVVHKTAGVLQRNLIHQRYPKLARYIPTALGMSIVPFLPCWVDAPVQSAVECFFARCIRKEPRLAYDYRELHLNAGGRRISSILRELSGANFRNDCNMIE